MDIPASWSHGGEKKMLRLIASETTSEWNMCNYCLDRGKTPNLPGCNRGKWKFRLRFHTKNPKKLMQCYPAGDEPAYWVGGPYPRYVSLPEGRISMVIPGHLGHQPRWHQWGCGLNGLEDVGKMVIHERWMDTDSASQPTPTPLT